MRRHGRLRGRDDRTLRRAGDRRGDRGGRALRGASARRHRQRAAPASGGGRSVSGVALRSGSAAEFAVAVEWAAAEGWNPGLDDLAAFHGTDPYGFFMGWIGSKPVSSISVVRYGATFGFLGFYIVHVDHRGTGAGLATWNHGMAYLQGRTVGLDGVVSQQANYRKCGFVLAGRNVRHSGVPPLSNRPATKVRSAT